MGNDSDSPSSGNSFVYPVRTLLSGIHSTHASSPDGNVAPGAQIIEAHDEQRHAAVAGTIIGDTEVDNGALPKLSTSTVAHVACAIDDRASREVQLGAEPAVPSSSKPSHRRRKHRSPNFRDFSLDEDPLAPRTFATNRVVSVMHGGGETASTLFTEGPTGEPVAYVPDDLQPADEIPDYNPRHPPQVSEVVAEAFTETSSGVFTGIDASPPPAPAGTNFSHRGYVHLAPIESPSSRSRSLGSSGRRRPRRDSDSGANSSSGVSNSDRGERELDVVQLPSTRPDSVASGSGSASGSVSGSANDSSSSDGPHITFRYSHVEDDNGHHLIVGREGKLTKCEDEVRIRSSPIQTWLSV